MGTGTSPFTSRRIFLLTSLNKYTVRKKSNFKINNKFEVNFKCMWTNQIRKILVYFYNPTKTITWIEIFEGPLRWGK